MTSYAIEVIQQLPSFRLNSDSSKSNNSHFGRIAHLLKETTKDVEDRWKEISQEDRQYLKLWAYRVLKLSNEENISQKNSGKSILLQLEGRFRLFVAIITGQGEVMIEAYVSAVKLAYAIVEAVEREEAYLTALFLDKIMEDIENNPSKLVPFTAEMNDKLEQLLDGVELDE
ncbi:hypothetical protein [Synechocystis sp. PCC 7509]|uniref:hypothetical protein n=1 Tax=Synechocystis sp. PCC 7509 TaxID=927677 RepID=UPI0002AC4CAA|nr:hypothetical protein [Synechocystis sp. PCC 7509]